MMNYCAQHKHRPEDMVWLAQTNLGPDVQVYLDAKYNCTLLMIGMSTCSLTIKSELSSDLMV